MCSRNFCDGVAFHLAGPTFKTLHHFMNICLCHFERIDRFNFINWFVEFFVFFILCETSKLLFDFQFHFFFFLIHTDIFFVFWFVLKQQHVFIPILPPSLIDYTCAPMPFLVGILHSSLDALYSLPLEEVLPLRCYILMFLCFSFLSLIWGVSRSTELISYVVDVDDVRCILSI